MSSIQFKTLKLDKPIAESIKLYRYSHNLSFWIKVSPGKNLEMQKQYIPSDVYQFIALEIQDKTICNIFLLDPFSNN
ncbi:hypothetical protein BpHYR1_017843 [Brachionus plicatilis]|uniref:Uncharacterized protein n=1 Tax=Brachionus plicatilis TaxID=10195 RepID=A0A3M7QWB9_BRAPC|nr:hypothetical protein BpHYR1_017843 [Brachionus plicatilis]